jgi:hypothetical protein
MIISPRAVMLHFLPFQLITWGFIALKPLTGSLLQESN